MTNAELADWLETEAVDWTYGGDGHQKIVLAAKRLRAVEALSALHETVQELPIPLRQVAQIYHEEWALRIQSDLHDLGGTDGNG